MDQLNPQFTQINKPQCQPTSGLIYDHIHLFTPSEPIFETEVYLKEDYIYKFSFETYTPFNPDFMLDTYLESPSGASYHLTNYSLDVIREEKIVYFHFGAAETGIYAFTINSQTSFNLNLYIFINETATVSEFFQESEEASFDKFNPEILDFYDIHRYHSYETEMIYNIPMQEDTEYWFNLFRVNSLVASDCNQVSYENPFIFMQVTLGGAEFIYWPESMVQTQPYALGTNIGSEGTGSMIHQNITMRFGSHHTGNATIKIILDYTKLINLNLAFLCFATQEIASNSTSGGIPDENDNNPKNETNTEIFDNLSNESTSELESAMNKMNNFIKENFDYCIFAVVCLMGVIFTVQKYNSFKKGHVPSEEFLTESDRS